MKRISLTIMLALFSINMMAQNNVAHFSFWKPKPGQEKSFEQGYKSHLQWHKRNDDPWTWYGWYFISGSRDNIFVDATFNHSWSDFDKSVKPVEDAADNELHTYPFGDFQAGLKVMNLEDLTISNSNSLESKFLRFITINVTNIESGKKIIDKLKSVYRQKEIKTFLTFKMIDGGNLNQFILLIGLNNFGEFGKVENLQDELSAIEDTLKVKTITSITSETLVYRVDMSLLHD